MCILYAVNNRINIPQENMLLIKSWTASQDCGILGVGVGGYRTAIIVIAGRPTHTRYFKK